jgi:predicted esterase YcpF (UPF0227 family)
MMLEKGFVLFAYDNVDGAVEQAKSYINRMQFTQKDVRIVATHDMVTVQAKRDLVLLNQNSDEAQA